MARRDLPYQVGASYSGKAGTYEDDLIARSKEWMNRNDRDKAWLRSVDDFLEDKGKFSRHHVSNSRERSPRDRSRSRERQDRSSRDRRESPARSMDSDDSGDYRRFLGEREISRREEFKKVGRNREERLSRGSNWDDEPYQGKEDADDEDELMDDNNWVTMDSWDDDNGSNYDRAEHEFNIGKLYGPESTQGEDRFAYKLQIPQKTIMVRGLAQHITESDIRSDIITSRVNFKDVRLIRRKDTGSSRGFAFVEFHNVADATRWIEMKQGELMLKDQFRALLQYSFPYYKKNVNLMRDWYCKCQAHNFRRRNTCYRCNLERKDGEVQAGANEISPYPTNTVLLRGLDALTTEEGVLKSIKVLSSLPIRSVKIGRDPLTNTSRCVCYLEMNNVVDAVNLYDALRKSNPIVDDRQIMVSYFAVSPAPTVGRLANTALAAAQWSHQTSSSDTSTGLSVTQYTLDDVTRLAEYSATLYATNPQEKTAYISYYESYYRKQIAEGAKIQLPVNATSSSTPTVYTAPAIKSSTPLTEAPDGLGNKSYPIPDVSTYQYDKSSGYYYDPYTTLYYDANSQYYFNSKSSKFLYWDSSKSTYLPAPTLGQQQEQTGTEKENDLKNEEDKKKDKEAERDKIKVAKRIAKDMAKWAKTLNHKKEIAKQNIVAAQQAAVAQMKAPGSADIGYAVLERKDISLPITPMLFSTVDPKVAKGESLVAAYSQGSDSEDEGHPDDIWTKQSSYFDEKHVDLSKMVCLLCKRQFPSHEVLQKHIQMSDLHKQNLASWYKSKGLDMDDAVQKKQYRDRAKERRLKFGEPDTPQPNRLKEHYMKVKESTVSYEEPTKDGIKSDNLGNKLLQKMGWQEGMGLGKSNQGRTNIIQAESRAATAGLGTKSTGIYTPGPGETYRDCVKKMARIRYNELE